MSERKLNTTHQTSKELLAKSKEMMERFKTTKKEYNPAPKESKESKDGKVQK
tara:strand:- start:10181 stop:10336 length:156 start_codon:yes stop_codon:yes gene_type:complete